MTLSEIEQYTEMYNKVKNIVLNKLIEEKLLDRDDAEEFSERNQVMIYRAKWVENWAKKYFGENYDPSGYYIKIMSMNEKEDNVTRLKRRTTSDYSKDDFEVV